MKLIQEIVVRIVSLDLSKMCALSVRTVCVKVLRRLEGVSAVLYGDFLECGVRQALFLPCASRSAVADRAADILSVIDAEMEVPQCDGDSFGPQFLLSDFSQVNIDRWNPTAVLFSLFPWCSPVVLSLFV